MDQQNPLPEIYQLYVWIRQISPLIWRRILVHNNSTIADLHFILQIAFSWSDFHLHRFRIHGQDYGISRAGTMGFSTLAEKVHLLDFQFRLNERFLYEYDFGDLWQHEVRLEQRLAVDSKRIYPICIGGDRAGVWSKYSWRVLRELRHPCETTNISSQLLLILGSMKVLHGMESLGLPTRTDLHR
jgi:hypothetical protein